ncbi:phosphatase PAP2 family protein [Demequina sp. SYSU T00192]|uniref:Phosphatase PAP2 family protein n=1 Tax=Demequina litoralis TaxID=3051660 RepID=A0ABT8GB88_9MICO|nr:phosphatase PAP2 family protein [Demequina sp. SYSU T00192]MDN4476398.1 phosphatase PAP2 family protein [Demequina sp. SYSU T00192]
MTHRMRASDVALALWPAVILVALGAVGFSVVLDWVTEREDLWRLDEPLLEWLAGGRTEGLTTFLTGVTNLFGPVFLPIVVAVIALLWWRVTRSWWEPALLVGAMVLSTVLSVTLKLAVGRTRPAADLMSIPGAETSGSFPSGHTIGATTLVLVVGYLLWHEDAEASWALAGWTIASLAVIVLVGASRLYLGYHFLTDVLAGACVAVAVLGVVAGLERWHDLSLERRDPPERPAPLGEAADEDLAWARAAVDDATAGVDLDGPGSDGAADGAGDQGGGGGSGPSRA